jgi:tetratricopeptide (TPR) repeat protein
MVGLVKSGIGRARGLGRTLGVLLLCAVICLGLCPLAWVIWGEHQFRAAQAANRKREFAQASEHIDKALRVFPKGAKTRLLAARIARRAGRFDEALGHLDICSGLVDSSEELLLERLLLRAQLGEMPPAAEARLANWVDEGHPDSLLILEVISQQFMRAYRLSDAMDCLDKWLELDPDDIWALLRRAWVFERFNQFEDSMKDYERVVELAPDLESPRIRLAVDLLRGKKDAKGAREHFQVMYDRGSRNSTVVVGLAECLWESGESEEARVLLNDATLSEVPNIDALQLKGTIAEAERRPEEAEECFRQAARLMPWSYEANFRLHRCLEQRGKQSEAQVFLDRANRAKTEDEHMMALTHKLQESRQDATIPCEIGQIFLRRGEPDEGVAWLRRALAVNPKLKAAHVALADYFESVHDTVNAARHRQMAQDGGASTSAGRSTGGTER